MEPVAADELDLEAVPFVPKLANLSWYALQRLRPVRFGLHVLGDPADAIGFHGPESLAVVAGEYLVARDGVHFVVPFEGLAEVANVSAAVDCAQVAPKSAALCFVVLKSTVCQ